ncbi:MAG: helix-turn-helix domain-containing protein [Acidobacteriaceae bacterium]
MSDSNTEDGRLAIKDSVQATIATNLVLARSVNAMTQDALAEQSGLSRATIAQIESGQGDPRLSTLTDIATALGVSPVLLLIGPQELSALADIPKVLPGTLFDTDQPAIDKIRRLVQSGLLRNRLKAAKIGVKAAVSAGFTTPGGLLGAALGSALMPGNFAVLATCAFVGGILGRRTDLDKVEDTVASATENLKGDSGD